jgi:hypothetical protein
MDQTHHSDIKYLECLRFDCTEKAVEENRMEKGTQDLASVLTIKGLFGGRMLTWIVI